MLSKEIYPKILRSLDFNRTLVNLDIEAIQNLACLQQKLLSLTAIKYGMYDIKTCSVVNNYLSSLAFRVVAVLKLFNAVELNTFDIEKTVLKRANSCKWIKYLSYANVLSHKVNTVKKVFLSKIKRSDRCLSILKVPDRLIQTLFVLVYEPIIECVSDVCSYGFRKSRHSHQAIGILSSKLSQRSKTPRGFYPSKYILKYDLHKFWGFLDRD